MDDILDQIRRASSAQLYYVALFTALALPDICGALESDDGHANKKRYIDWCDRYLMPKYGDGFTGADCYYFR